MLNFCPGGKQASQLTARIDGIDRTFLFGNGAASGVHPRCSPFPSCLGATQVIWGLALLLIYYSNMYLKFKTTPRSFGEGLATLTPGLGGINLLTVCATGERSIRPFRSLFY